MQGLQVPATTYTPGDTALIIGAGLAGCAVANTLATQGFNCQLFDSHATTAAASSAVPIAIYRPYLSVGESAVNHYFSNAFKRMVDEIKTIDLNNDSVSGLLQLVTDDRQWTDGEHHRLLSSAEASDKLNRTITHSALYIKDAGTLIPAKLCGHWLGNTNRIKLNVNCNVRQIKKTPDGWELRDSKNNLIGSGHFVVLANSFQANLFLKEHLLPLTPISGQITRFSTNRTPNKPSPVIENKGYAIPTDRGYWVGATHHRNCTDNSLRKRDNEVNHSKLRSLANTAGIATDSWAGVRCATPDRLPLVGGIPDSNFFKLAYRELHHGRKTQVFPPAEHIEGLYVTAGMGSRGATQALYAAELLTNIITGIPDANPAIYKAVNPARFLVMSLQRRPIS